MYYVSTSKLLGPPEMGTFASQDIAQGEMIGFGVFIPFGSKRGDIEWEFSELVKMTNHSEGNDNVEGKYVRDEKRNLITYIKAKKPIKKGEEFLLNYKSLPYSKYIDLSFLDPEAGKHFVYHFLTEIGVDLYFEHGLCSPRRLYDYNLEMFEKTVKPRYAIKAARFFDKNIFDITNNDILDYLDSITKKQVKGSNGFSSKSICFSLIPLDKFHSDYHLKLSMPQYEVKLDIVRLHSSFKPTLINRGGFEEISWDKIKDTDYIKSIEDMAKIRPTVSDNLFGTIPYISIPDVYFISSDLFEKKLEIYE